MDYISELFKALMKEYPVETRKKMSQDYCELDHTFMGFEDKYQLAADIVPKEKTIIDIGCYMGAQGYYFRDFPRYIGVDLPGTKDFYVERFEFNNTTHYENDGASWIKDVFPTLNLDLKDVFVICSAVPNEPLNQLIKDTFPNHLVWYPGNPCEIILDGVDLSDTIEQEEIETPDYSIFLD